MLTVTSLSAIRDAHGVDSTNACHLTGRREVIFLEILCYAFLVVINATMPTKIPAASQVNTLKN